MFYWKPRPDNFLSNLWKTKIVAGFAHGTSSPRYCCTMGQAHIVGILIMYVCSVRVDKFHSYSYWRSNQTLNPIYHAKNWRKILIINFFKFFIKKIQLELFKGGLNLTEFGLIFNQRHHVMADIIFYSCLLIARPPAPLNPTEMAFKHYGWVVVISTTQ